MSDPERTTDGRYVVIEGRKWRASDPKIPENLRAELVAELMDARRAVKVGSPPARSRVQDAKVALGERGPRWWEPLSGDDLEVRISATIRALLRKRQPRTICPSDVARVIGGERWRTQMELVRDVAAGLVDREELVALQRQQVVDIRQVRGPIRLAGGPRMDAGLAES